MNTLHLSIRDVPVEVLYNVWKKWSNIQSWSNSVWHWCSMCTYMLQFSYEDRCDYCPLKCNGWCGDERAASRLNIDAHDNEKSWLDDVEIFVREIENELFVRDMGDDYMGECNVLPGM